MDVGKRQLQYTRARKKVEAMTTSIKTQMQHRVSIEATAENQWRANLVPSTVLDIYGVSYDQFTAYGKVHEEQGMVDVDSITLSRINPPKHSSYLVRNYRVPSRYGYHTDAAANAVLSCLYNLVFVWWIDNKDAVRAAAMNYRADAADTLKRQLRDVETLREVLQNNLAACENGEAFSPYPLDGSLPKITKPETRS